jgi:hypothetical protein
LGFWDLISASAKSSNENDDENDENNFVLKVVETFSKNVKKRDFQKVVKNVIKISILCQKVVKNHQNHRFETTKVWCESIEKPLKSAQKWSKMVKNG